MTIAFIGQSVPVSGGTATSFTVTYSSTAGSSLILRVLNPQVISSVTDSAGNTWAQAATSGGTSQRSCAIWYSFAATAVTSITVNLAASSSFHVAAVTEWSGVTGLRATAVDTGATASTTHAAVVAGLAGDLVIGDASYFSTTSVRLDTLTDAAYTALTGGSKGSSFEDAAYKILTVAETTGPTWSTSSSVGVGLVTAAFSGAAVGTVAAVPATATASAVAPAVAGSSAVGFRAGAANSGRESSTSGTVAVTLPASIAAGDYLLIAVTSANTDFTITTPTGWTLYDQVQLSNNGKVWLFTKVAATGDAGSSVGFAYTTSTLGVKWAIAAGGWTGVDTTSPVQVEASLSETVNQSTHTTPATSSPMSGLQVEIATDRASTGNTSWTVPGTVTRRIDVYGGGAGGASTVVADAAVPKGTVGGNLYTSAVSSVNAATFTLVLQPVIAAGSGGVIPTVATATAAAVQPAVVGGMSLSGGSPMAATATAHPAAVTTGSEPAPATAAAAGALPAPVVSAGATITATVATAHASLLPPAGTGEGAAAFVDQIFSATVTPTRLSVTATPDALSSTVRRDAYTAAVTLYSLHGTATKLGS